MKTLGLAATLMLLGTLTLASADVTVDDQIAAIAAATPEQRTTLVNDFKETLSTLSDKDRAAAIEQMGAAISATGKQQQTQAQTKQRSRIGQMEQNKDTQMGQHMSQQQTASQAMKQGMIKSNAVPGVPKNFIGHK